MKLIVRKDSSSKSTYHIVASLIATLSAFLALINHFLQLLKFDFTDVLIFVVLFFWLYLVYIRIAAYKEKGQVYLTEGQVQNTKYLYPNLRGKILWAIWILPIIIFTTIASRICKPCLNAEELSIVIASFKEKEKDLFSTALFGDISQRGIESLKATEYIDIKNRSNWRTIMDRNCVKSGILVYGDQNTAENFFQCKVQLMGLNIDEADTLIQDINDQQFEIHSYSDVIADYLAAIFKNDSTLAKRALRNSDVKDILFQALCHQRLGLIHMRNEKYEQALLAFTEAERLMKNEGPNFSQSNAAVIKFINQKFPHQDSLKVKESIKYSTGVEKSNNAEDAKIEEDNVDDNISAKDVKIKGEESLNEESMNDEVSEENGTVEDDTNAEDAKIDDTEDGLEQEKPPYKKLTVLEGKARFIQIKINMDHQIIIIKTSDSVDLSYIEEDKSSKVPKVKKSVQDYVYGLNNNTSYRIRTSEIKKDPTNRFQISTEKGATYFLIINNVDDPVDSVTVEIYKENGL